MAGKIVVVRYEEIDGVLHIREIYGPFEIWSAAEDFIRDKGMETVIYTLHDPGVISPDPAPRPIEFMARGHDLATALDAIARWGSLTKIDRAKLGFIGDAIQSAPKAPLSGLH